MFILIKDHKGNDHVVKKSDVRRVTADLGKRTMVRFASPRINLPIIVSEPVAEFFEKYLS